MRWLTPLLALHAGTHVWDAAAGREAWSGLVADLPGVFALPALAIWLARPRAGAPA
ncbi:MAG TPA: hypothetical protein VHE37_04960 [Nevskiaceae bacterium]|nr:hypothetical protein [Nevskiaceae bacterium]